MRDPVLDLPQGWLRIPEPAAGVVFVAVEPDEGQPFRANLVVTADPLASMSLRDWQLQTDVALPRALVDLLLLDLEHVRIDGHPGVRRLAHHLVNGIAVTMEQWATVSDDIGWTLTATVPTLAYATVADAVAAAASSWRLPS